MAIEQLAGLDLAKLGAGIAIGFEIGRAHV